MVGNVKAEHLALERKLVALCPLGTLGNVVDRFWLVPQAVEVETHLSVRFVALEAHGRVNRVFVNLEESWTLQGSALYDDSYAKIDGQWRIMYTTYERLFEQTTPRDPRTKLGSKSVKDTEK